MPEEISKVLELFFLAYELKLVDLMSRCESELVNRISYSSVVDILIRLYPHMNAPKPVN